MTDKIFIEAYNDAAAKVERNSGRIGLAFPQAVPDGEREYNREEPDYWTGGFWGGQLWLDYRALKKEPLRELARAIEEAQDVPLNEFTKLHHDVGFMWLPTAVLDYRLTGREESRVRGLKAAAILASRFNLNGRFIRAWNEENRENSQGLAIIDCLMNLPLLYWASRELNDPRYAQIARAHTDTVLAHFVREDATVPHIVEFDAGTGAYRGPAVGQGKSPDSAWSRGQAWAVYGFAAAYRETGEACYLRTAERMAKRFFENLPEDGIPYWDFCSDEKDRYARDSTAACVAASGMLEIAGLTKEDREKEYFTGCAGKILENIITNVADFGDDTQGIVRMGTVNYAQKRYINTSVIYGDFYFIEALGKMQGLTGAF